MDPPTRPGAEPATSAPPLARRGAMGLASLPGEAAPAIGPITRACITAAALALLVAPSLIIVALSLVGLMG